MTQYTTLSLCSAALFVALLGSAPGAAQAQKPDVFGVWIDHTGRGAVEFKHCGTLLCGQIVWLEKPNDDKGRPLTDGNNPDARLRNRPICGLPIIGDAAPQGSATFDGGWIYNPEDGKSYKVEVKQISPNILTVTGYLGIKFLGQTFTWKRAPATQARCATATRT